MSLVREIAKRLRDSGSVYAEDEAELLMAEAKSPAELESMIQRRIDGEPIEYIVGWAEFCGLRIKVAPGVFVPRRRSEFLVNQAIKFAKSYAVIVDLGCGSGALGLAVVSKVEDAMLFATDIDPTAVACARENIEAVGEVFEGELFASLPISIAGHVDILLANMPYVPTSAIELMPQEARNFENRSTLDGGHDGLDIHRRVAAEADEWLAPNGAVLIEVSQQQASAAVEIMTKHGLLARVAQDSDLGATIIIATKA